MKTVWKFNIEVTDSQKISMPKGAEILTVDVQLGKPAVWVLVNPVELPEERTLEVFGTGHPIDAGVGQIGYNRKYIGSFQLEDGAFVGHLFENKEEE